MKKIKLVGLFIGYFFLTSNNGIFGKNEVKNDKIEKNISGKNEIKFDKNEKSDKSKEIKIDNKEDKLEKISVVDEIENELKKTIDILKNKSKEKVIEIEALYNIKEKNKNDKYNYIVEELEEKIKRKQDEINELKEIIMEKNNQLEKEKSLYEKRIEELDEVLENFKSSAIIGEKSDDESLLEEVEIHNSIIEKKIKKLNDNIMKIKNKHYKKLEKIQNTEEKLRKKIKKIEDNIEFDQKRLEKYKEYYKISMNNFYQKKKNKINQIKENFQATINIYINRINNKDYKDISIKLFKDYNEKNKKTS